MHGAAASARWRCQAHVCVEVNTVFELIYHLGSDVQELAPQDAKGGYQRPSYAFGNRIGSPGFPLERNRYVRHRLLVT